MRSSMIYMKSETADSNALAVSETTVSIAYLVGGASLFVCVAWLYQAMLFTGNDAKTAAVLWTLLASVIAGAGAACLYAARCWFSTGNAR